MRLGIVSDIHGNIEALHASVEALKRAGAERFACLGDLMGYGASPNEVCDVVRRLEAPTILGNHDAAVSGRMDYSYYYDAARRALDWCGEVLAPDHLAWLKTLPYTERIEHVGLCHGSPIRVEEFEYLFLVEQAELLLPKLAELPPITFIGHTHLVKAFQLGERGVTPIKKRTFRLEDGMKYVVSVGSVGQPRDFDNRASFCLYDLATREVQLLRASYDIGAASNRILAAKLPLNFSKRLWLGV